MARFIRPFVPLAVLIAISCGTSIPIVLTPAGAIAATPSLSPAPPPKVATAVPATPLHVTPAQRVGGDDIASAVPIPAVPYADTGNTCGYNDDYNEICPAPFDNAPDVVYSYTPDDWMYVNIDLCGSAFDTKLYVYDEDLNLVACNDDYYYDDDCGLFVSALLYVELAAGVIYYIVIDGRSDYVCGEYIIQVTETSECFLECPDEGNVVYENEPPLVDGYEDVFNSGCGAPGPDPLFSEPCGDENGTLTFCAISGWYDYAGEGYRDTDWILVHMGESGTLTWSVDAEQATYLFHIAPPDCNTVEVVQSMAVGPCIPASMTITGESNEVIWLWIGPQNYDPPIGFDGHEFDYIMTLEGIAECPVAAEASSWSRVKSLYR